MTEEEEQQYQQSSPDYGPKIRDLEEKQRILKDRILLIGDALVEEKEENKKEIHLMMSEIIKLKKENERMKEIIERLTEQATDLARKEELMILQRQFDLFRGE